MSQKIVITANMKGPAESTVPTTTYQWHWRRIIIAVGVVLLLLSAFYGLISSVNAEQSSLDDTPNTIIKATELDDEVADNSLAGVELQPEPVAEVSSKLTDEVTVTAPELEAKEAQFERSDLQQSSQTYSSDAAKEQELTTDSAQQKPIEMQENEVAAELAQEQPLEADSTQPEKRFEQGGHEGFSQSSHVANVALGASIDTNKVSRAVLTREVQNREPVNVFQADVRLSDFTETLAFFSELKNLQGQRIQHVWYYQEQAVATINLKVTTPRYRTYSNKNIMSEQVGHWRVDVLDEQGHLLAKKEFRILAN